MVETVYKAALPFRVAFLSDTHDTKNSLIIDSLRRNSADMICIAGDIFCGIPQKDAVCFLDEHKNTLELLKFCADTAPTFLSLGNHEEYISKTDIEKIESLGINVLDNTWTDHRGIAIGGLTSAKVSAYARYRSAVLSSHNYPRKDHAIYSAIDIAPDLSWLDGFESFQGYKLLLCHHPEYWDTYLKGRDIDLILSGHAHGGQIRLFRQGLFAPGQGLFPRYTGGVYGNMIVGRGLANTGYPIPRLFNPCELIYLEPN